MFRRRFVKFLERKVKVTPFSVQHVDLSSFARLAQPFREQNFKLCIANHHVPCIFRRRECSRSLRDIFFDVKACPRGAGTFSIGVVEGIF